MSLFSADQLNPAGFFTPVTDHTSAISEGSYTWLAQFGLLRVCGPDSERFLQGQLTCDVAKLSEDQWLLGACCTAKGRMVANFIIARDAQGYWLRLPLMQVDALAQHLKKYAVFFKTELLNFTASHKVIGSYHASETDLPATLTWSESGAQLQHHDGRREYWLTNDAAEQLLNEQLQTEQPLKNSEDWALADIQQGLIWVTEASREHWIPQNINWQHLGGVSFNKGCYTGQEIVARLQYLGKAKKAVFLLSSEQAASPELLSSIKDSTGKAIGELASWHHTHGIALLNDDDSLSVIELQDKEIGQFSATLKKLSYTEEQETHADA
ncbi:YgfZ/GcvT domain-containing protein [Bacterioplanoides sp.]|uniref:CAF17-like 4Fe-4S cluster assembly/insertion protein YgfZ n=1 Tax=Bacterioplanoides sp. TaxID=2066072 RepID=UPI003B00EF68